MAADAPADRDSSALRPTGTLVSSVSARVRLPFCSLSGLASSFGAEKSVRSDAADLRYFPRLLPARSMLTSVLSVSSLMMTLDM